MTAPPIPIVIAAFAHHAFVAVHPFADGNGRVARLLASIYTMRAASVPLMIWADQSIDVPGRAEAGRRGDPQPFVDFVFDRTTDAMNLMEDRLRRRGVPSGFAEPDDDVVLQTKPHNASVPSSTGQSRTLRPALPAALRVNVEQARAGRRGPRAVSTVSGRRAVLMAPRGQRHVAFSVVVPRGRSTLSRSSSSGTDEMRAFRAKEIVPELRDAVVEQVRASFDGSSARRPENSSADRSVNAKRPRPKAGPLRRSVLIVRRRAGRGRRCRSTGDAASTWHGPRSGGCAHG